MAIPEPAENGGIVRSELPRCWTQDGGCASHLNIAAFKFPCIQGMHDIFKGTKGLSPLPPVNSSPLQRPQKSQPEQCMLYFLAPSGALIAIPTYY